MTFFNDKKTNLSRRNLLKGLGACAALPLLGGIFPKSALAQAISTALSQFPTLVPAQKGILTGAHWGAFEAIVEDGRMVRVQPVADDPAPNDLIDMAPFQVHAKNRI
ncbi:MAG: twin-arginine translocation signal domain-containing protein, partial [Aeromonas veronii]